MAKLQVARLRARAPAQARMCIWLRHPGCRTCLAFVWSCAARCYSNICSLTTREPSKLIDAWPCEWQPSSCRGCKYQRWCAANYTHNVLPFWQSGTSQRTFSCFLSPFPCAGLGNRICCMCRTSMVQWSSGGFRPNQSMRA